MSRILSEVRRLADNELVEDVAALVAIAAFVCATAWLCAGGSAAVAAWRLSQ